MSTAADQAVPANADRATTDAPRRTRRRPALERVVATADRLFYENGIHATGVDAIADAANVSKASMYTYFRTKDDLVGAYVQGRSRAWRDVLTADLDGSDAPAADKIMRVFDLLGEWFRTPDYNGCPFINAEAESAADSPAHRANIEHRTWLRGVFSDLLAEAGADGQEGLALQLAMLYDGAMVGAHAEPQFAWADEARNAAAVLVRGAVGG